MRPVIGIPIGRHLPADPGYLRIRRTYPDAVLAAGGAPVLLPPVGDVAAELARGLDGLLFAGGADVEPNRYGEAPHETTVCDPLLDESELQFAAWACETEMPTLGICRGHQLLNVALGGSLIQDLPSEGKRGHRQTGARTDLAHAIRLEPSSRLAGIFGETTLQVNSLHHQGVRKPGRSLQPVGWSPDGLVEAMESSDHPWLLTVQFHPEDLVGFHTPSQRLLRAFVDACRERASARSR